MFDRIFAALAAEGGLPDRLMIASTYLKAHRTAASLLKKGLFPAASGDTQGRAELQAPRRLRRPGTPRRAAAHRGASERPSRRCHHAPATGASPRELIADRGYDSARLTALRALPPARTGLQTRGITPCIPFNSQSEGPYPTRHYALPPTPAHRDPVRPAERLATHRHARRPARAHLPRSHHPRRHRHLLAQSMSPEPNAPART